MDITLSTINFLEDSRYSIAVQLIINQEFHNLKSIAPKKG